MTVAPAAQDARVAAAAKAISGRRFRLLRHAPAAGAWNMAVDEVLLSGAGAEPSLPSLRFYGWNPPALSVGRFQDSGTGIDLSVCHKNRWEIVRRPTGGRAVLHHDEITFSIVVPLALVAGVGVLPSYCLFSRAMNAALEGMGIDPSPCPLSASGRGQGEGSSCFASALAPDSLVGGRKLMGAAQVRRRGTLLQHGSLLISVDREALAALFGAVGPVVSLSEIVPDLPPREVLVDDLAKRFAEGLGITLEPGELTAVEKDAVAHCMESGERGGTRSPGRRAALDSA